MDSNTAYRNLIMRAISTNLKSNYIWMLYFELRIKTLRKSYLESCINL